MQHIVKGEPVRYKGKRYRVREVTNGMVKIQDVEGRVLIVQANSVERGW